MSEISRFRFVIDGRPVPKGRPRFGKGRVHTPKKTKEFEHKVKVLALDARNKAHLKAHDGPVTLLLAFDKKQAVCDVVYLQPSESYNTGTPDLDNLIKAVSDALNGVAYEDDSQVVEMQAVKLA